MHGIGNPVIYGDHRFISAARDSEIMKSIIALAVLLSIVLPCMALSPVEQAFVNGVNEGVRLGQLMGSADQYNAAAQRYNDMLNQTFPANASTMWLPLMAINETDESMSYISTKPIHKMDGTPAETVVMQE